jgi:mono/diheme cytochrome c family protein
MPLTRYCRRIAGDGRFVVFALLLQAGLATAQTATTTSDGVDARTGDAQLSERLAIGQRIYRDGVRASGEPLTAIGAAQANLSGKDVACAACHRRSGYGTSEGRFVIRPITGPALQQQQTVAVHGPRIKALLGTAQRPPYTEASLARAVRSGVDAAGKALDALMPRYDLTDEETAAVAAYLFSLSSKPSPGVDEQEIHFATVIQPGVAAERRRAMLDVMQAFVKDKDGDARSEDLRREAGSMRMYRAYRKWVLHVWELTGPSETWNAQLEALYSARPVFALIGGLGESSWRPIHEFSERFGIPSVFPQTDLPAIARTDFYTFYFSKGLTLEAEVLAKFLGEQPQPWGQVVQVYRRGEAGSTAAAALRGALATRMPIDDQVLQGPADEAAWRRVCAAKPRVVVLWLGVADINVDWARAGECSPTLYLSFGLFGSQLSDRILRAPGSDVRMIYPSDSPPKHETRLLRSKLWLHNKGIPVSNESVQVNSQFTMAVVSDVVGHIADNFSRDYFVERIEHVVAQTPAASLFPQVSLGPGQRFAAKGAGIVQLVDAEKSSLTPISAWIVP